MSSSQVKTWMSSFLFFPHLLGLPQVRKNGIWSGFKRIGQQENIVDQGSGAIKSKQFMRRAENEKARLFVNLRLKIKKIINLKSKTKYL